LAAGAAEGRVVFADGASILTLFVSLRFASDAALAGAAAALTGLRAVAGLRAAVLVVVFVGIVVPEKFPVRWAR
jgi:hypothetical protein